MNYHSPQKYLSHSYLILWVELQLPHSRGSSLGEAPGLSWTLRCLVCDCSNSKEDSYPHLSLPSLTLGRLEDAGHQIFCYVRSQSIKKGNKPDTKQS